MLARKQPRQPAFSARRAFHPLETSDEELSEVMDSELTASELWRQSAKSLESQPRRGGSV